MYFLYAKAIHIIFVICWMAGLFYMVRLFIYHTEAKLKTKEEYTILHGQFKIMESKLWWIITTPSMYLTLLAGITMLYLSPSLLQAPWMHVKLIFVLGLLIYHFICQRIFYRLKQEKNRWSSTQLRLWNELATVLLFAIVFVAVLKSTTDWVKGLVGLLLLSLMLMVAVKIYKKFRTKAK